MHWSSSIPQTELPSLARIRIVQLKELRVIAKNQFSRSNFFRSLRPSGNSLNSRNQRDSNKFKLLTNRETRRCLLQDLGVVRG